VRLRDLWLPTAAWRGQAFQTPRCPGQPLGSVAQSVALRSRCGCRSTTSRAADGGGPGGGTGAQRRRTPDGAVGMSAFGRSGCFRQPSCPHKQARSHLVRLVPAHSSRQSSCRAGRLLLDVRELSDQQARPQ
jgi:hypothetical protein